MRLSQRDRKAVILGAAVIVAAVALKFAVMPLIDRWLEARSDIVAQRAAIAAIDQRVSRLGAMQALLKPAYGDGVGKPLDDVNLTRLTFHKRVQDMLKTAGIAFTSIQPQEPRSLREVDGVVLVGLRVSGACQLPQLTNCLSAMRNADGVIIVESIDVTGDEKKPGQLSVTMLLSTPARGSVKR